MRHAPGLSSDVGAAVVSTRPGGLVLSTKLQSVVEAACHLLVAPIRSFAVAGRCWIGEDRLSSRPAMVSARLLVLPPPIRNLALSTLRHSPHQSSTASDRTLRTISVATLTRTYTRLVGEERGITHATKLMIKRF